MTPASSTAKIVAWVLPVTFRRRARRMNDTAGTLSRRKPGKDEIVVFHVGRMAGETFFVLGLAHRLAVDELAEAPAACRGVSVRVFDHELHRRGRAGDEDAVELGRRHMRPRELGQDRPIREGERAGPIRRHRDRVAEDAAQLVKARRVRGGDQLPLPVSGRDLDPEDRRGLVVRSSGRERERGEDARGDRRRDHNPGDSSHRWLPLRPITVNDRGSPGRRRSSSALGRFVPGLQGGFAPCRRLGAPRDDAIYFFSTFHMNMTGEMITPLIVLRYAVGLTNWPGTMWVTTWNASSWTAAAIRG